MILWGTLVYCPLAHWVWDDGMLLGTSDGQPHVLGSGVRLRRRNGRAHQLGDLGPGLRAWSWGNGWASDRADAAPQPDLHLPRRGTVVGRLVRLQCRQRACGRRISGRRLRRTHLARPPGGCAWAGMEWVTRGKPSVLGACSGAVAGLVCITPASGFVLPDVGTDHGLGGGRRLLPGLHDAQDRGSATTIRSTHSAFTASAARWARF